MSEMKIKSETSHITSKVKKMEVSGTIYKIFFCLFQYIEGSSIVSNKSRI